MKDCFRHTLREVGVPDDATLAVAVSGGADSLALLLLAHADRPGHVRAATVDHGLRPESHDEALFVAQMCADRGIPHDVLAVTVTGSLQAGARHARYAALADWCARCGVGWLATAHHADDQAETVLMRLGRGSGLSGLSAIRARRMLAPGVSLVRPLLAWRRTELAQIVADKGLQPIDDPGNRDPRYDRTTVRALIATSKLDPSRLAASAAHLAEAEAALAWATDEAERTRIHGGALDPADLPPELLRRLVLRLLARAGVEPRGRDLTRLIAALQAGRPATLGGVKALPGPRWRLVPAPPRRRSSPHPPG